MATAANTQVSPDHREHVFDELDPRLNQVCELCKQELAAYAWSQQGNATAPRKHEISVCRICAGMILLIGKPAPAY
jgi:hypothetical protein